MSTILNIRRDKKHRCFYITTVAGVYKIKMIRYFVNERTLAPALYVKNRGIICLSRWKIYRVFSREHMEIHAIERLTKEAATQKFEPLIAEFESAEKRKKDAHLTWDKSNE